MYTIVENVTNIHVYLLKNLKYDHAVLSKHIHNNNNRKQNTQTECGRSTGKSSSSNSIHSHVIEVKNRLSYGAYITYYSKSLYMINTSKP